MENTADKVPGRCLTTCFSPDKASKRFHEKCAGTACWIDYFRSDGKALKDWIQYEMDDLHWCVVKALGYRLIRFARPCELFIYRTDQTARNRLEPKPEKAALSLLAGN